MSRIAKCLVVGGLWVGLLGGVEAGAADKPAKPTRIKISKETTYLLEPLDAEGYVDYIEATNQRAAKSVTAATNFEVVVRAVLGPKSISEGDREEYFRRLGLKRPSENFPYFQDFNRFHSQEKGATPEELNKEHDLLMSQPWSDKDHPRGAAWLKAMSGFLDQIVEGTRLPHMYVPYIGGSDPMEPRMISVLLPSVQDQRMLARSLLIRAQSRMAQGDVDGAWSDVQAIHRQARLVAHGFSLIEALVGVALDAMACDADVKFLQSRKLTAAQVRQRLGDLAALAPLPPISEKIGQGERMMSLDAVQSLARSNGKSLNSVFGLSGGDGTKTDVSVFSPLFALAIDWNTTMQLINKEYDKILPVLQEPDFGARKKKHDEYDSQVKEMAARSKSAVNLVATSLLGTSQSRGHNIGEVLIVLLMPAIRQVSVAETRAEARMTVTRAAFAAELYRLDNGQYPESLDQLVPKSLEAVPSDPFTGKPLVYRRDEAAGFVVYSLGPNETDDDGRSYQAGKTTDDVAATGLPRKEDGP